MDGYFWKREFGNTLWHVRKQIFSVKMRITGRKRMKFIPGDSISIKKIVFVDFRSREDITKTIENLHLLRRVAMEALIPILVYGFFGAIALAGGFIFYLRAVASRKHYRCPHCREIIRVELMEAIYCNCCGSPLHPGEDDYAY